jgi:hypothetical protein
VKELWDVSLKQLEALFYLWVSDHGWLDAIQVRCARLTSRFSPHGAAEQMAIIDEECVIKGCIPCSLIDTLSLILLARPNVEQINREQLR